MLHNRKEWLFRRLSAGRLIRRSERLGGAHLYMITGASYWDFVQFVQHMIAMSWDSNPRHEEIYEIRFLQSDLRGDMRQCGGNPVFLLPPWLCRATRLARAAIRLHTLTQSAGLVCDLVETWRS